MVTEAQKNACRRYYEKSKENWRVIVLRLDKRKDADVIEAIDSQSNKTAYVKELVRGDIDG